MPPPFLLSASHQPVTALRQQTVLLIGDRLQPFIGGLFPRHLYGQMGKPAVLGGAVPVFDPGGDHHGVAGLELPGFLAPFLLPAPALGAEQDLAAVLLCLVDVPVVAAARLKGHVGDGHACCGQHL